MKEIIIKETTILVPEDSKGLIKRLNTLSSMNLYFINKWQNEKRFYPTSDAGCEDYCLYLGSTEETLLDNDGNEYTEKYDLWHYPYYLSSHPRYSTAIICGNDLGNYMSGWPSLALDRGCYKQLMRREVVGGLITEPDIIVSLGLAALDLRADMGEVQYNESINKAGGGVQPHETDGDMFDYVGSDWWYEHWLSDQLDEFLLKDSKE